MGGGIRLYKLGTRSCWIDELYTLDRALGPWGGDPRQPFLLLTRLSLQLFGVNAFALRFFPFLFGTLTMLGVYHLARAMFDRRVALLAVFCVTFSPWHIYLSQFGRAYAIVVFIAVWAALHFFRFLQTHRFVNLVLFLSLFAISFFLHNTAAFLLVIAVFVLLALSWLGPLKDTADARRMRLTAVLLVGVSLIFAPGFYRFVLHWHEKQLTSGYWGTTPLVFALKLAYHLTPTVAVAALLGSIQVLRKQTVKGVFLVCYLLLAPLALALASAFRVNVSAKYASLVLPAFAVAAAYFVGHLAEQSKSTLVLVGL
ncbi:MAG: glycosyltransferase family 39 protein, partial [candidate division KSB1 bacterium]|nr:glycosyltransferase family 39 protein [candidate division KSB1 bacterium]